MAGRPKHTQNTHLMREGRNGGTRRSIFTRDSWPQQYVHCLIWSPRTWLLHNKTSPKPWKRNTKAIYRYHCELERAVLPQMAFTSDRGLEAHKGGQAARVASSESSSARVRVCTHMHITSCCHKAPDACPERWAVVCRL